MLYKTECDHPKCDITRLLTMAYVHIISSFRKPLRSFEMNVSPGLRDVLIVIKSNVHVH